MAIDSVQNQPAAAGMTQQRPRMVSESELAERARMAETMREKPRKMSATEQAELERTVNELNSQVNKGRVSQQQLGKDEFLKLLVTQLSYQDPMSPMEDKQFIAQMAQFSSLEQMTNIAGEFNRLTNLFTGSEAAGALGRSVELAAGEHTVQGVVKSVTRGGGVPQVLVNGTYYAWDQVTRVFEE